MSAQVRLLLAALGTLAAHRAIAAKPRAATVLADITGDLPARAITAVAVDPADDDTLYAGGDGFLFATVDGGEHWRAVLSFAPGFDIDEAGDESDVDEDGDSTDRVSVAPGVRAIAFGDGALFAATSRGLFRTVDAGATFTRVELAGPDANDVRAVVASRGSLFVATAAGAFVGRDRGATFAHVDGEPALCAAAGVDGTIWFGTGRGLFSLDVEHKAVARVPLLGDADEAGARVTSVAVSPKSGAVWAGTDRGLFARFRSRGDDDAAFNRMDACGAAPIAALAPERDTLRGLALACSTEPRVRTSRDGGRTVDAAALDVDGMVLSLDRGRRRGDLVVATTRGVFRAAASEATRVDATDLARLRAAWSRSSLDDIDARVVRDHGFDPRALQSMAERASWAHALPSVRLEASARTGTLEQDHLVVRGVDTLPTRADPAGDPSLDPAASIASPARTSSAAALVMLSWDLDALVWNRDEAELARLEPAMAAARERVLARVSALAFSRRRLDLQARTARGLDVHERIDLDEIAAELDALAPAVAPAPEARP